MRAIGLMSGTSLDGIDAAVIETDGEIISRFGPGQLGTPVNRRKGKWASAALFHVKGLPFYDPCGINPRACRSVN